MKQLHDIITKNILKKLEEGVVPWKEPWQSSLPRNISGRRYNGLNLLLLGMEEYSCPIWATEDQINKLNGKIKKGEAGTFIFFWRPLSKSCRNCEGYQDGVCIWYIEDSSRCNHFVPKYGYATKTYVVFNLEQTTLNIEDYWKPVCNKFEPIKRAEQIVSNMPNPPKIRMDGHLACYYKPIDLILLPPKESFFKKEEFYLTLFHELVHSTGHETRLNRKIFTSSYCFGDKEYSEEELVAELGASFLCAESNIKIKIDSPASYIEAWLKILQYDKKILFFAASKASKAVDYILRKKSNKRREQDVTRRQDGTSSK